MKLTIKQENHYGTSHFYLVDKKKAEAFKRLTGRKTITRSDVKGLEKLTGRKIEIRHTTNWNEEKENF